MKNFDKAAAEVFNLLQAHKSRVASTDLRIAPIALANNMTLLTRNAKEIGKIPGLKFEDRTV